MNQGPEFEVNHGSLSDGELGDFASIQIQDNYMELSDGEEMSPSPKIIKEKFVNSPAKETIQQEIDIVIEE